MTRLWIGVLAVAGVVSGAWAQDGTDIVPPRTDAGQALVVPDAQLDAGEVYHVQPGTCTQLTWTTQTPLLRYVAACNRVVGYLVLPFDLAEAESPLLAGAVRIPVASLRTGVASVDEEWHGGLLLNAAEHPEITLRVKQVGGVERLGDERGRLRYRLEVTFGLNVKGQEVEIQAPASLVHVPFTWQTMNKSLGDFATLQTTLRVKPADIGLTQTQRDGDFRFEECVLDLSLMCGTVSPERVIDPGVNVGHVHKQMQFLTRLRDFRNATEAYAYARALLPELWDAPSALRQFAETIVGEEDLPWRDFALAEKLIARANALTEESDPAVLAAAARMEFERGNVDAAVQWGQRAVEHLEDAPPYMAADVRAALARYEAARDAKP